MCAVEDCEPWTVHNQTLPVARKEYCCGECGRTIKPGEKYCKDVGLCDGRWSTNRTCLHCQAMGSWMNVMCQGYPLGWLYSELVEHFREGYSSVQFGRLIIQMRQKWHDGADPVPTGMAAMAQEMLRKSVAA